MGDKSCYMGAGGYSAPNATITPGSGYTREEYAYGSSAPANNTNNYAPKPVRQDFVGFDEEKSKNKKSAYANVTKSIGTKYYEEYLNMQKCGPNTEIIEPKDDIVAFNSPFYFIHAKHIGTETIPFIHSIGRFTNGDIDNWKHQEA